MPTKNITDLFADRVKPPARGRIEYFDAGFGSLALRVTSNGHKSWSLFYRSGGRQRRFTLGPFPALKPKAARREASRVLEQVAWVLIRSLSARRSATSGRPSRRRSAPQRRTISLATLRETPPRAPMRKPSACSRAMTSRRGKSGRWRRLHGATSTTSSTRSHSEPNSGQPHAGKTAHIFQLGGGERAHLSLAGWWHEAAD